MLKVQQWPYLMAESGGESGGSDGGSLNVDADAGAGAVAAPAEAGVTDRADVSPPSAAGMVAPASVSMTPPEAARQRTSEPAPTRTERTGRRPTPTSDVAPEPNPVEQARETLIENWRDLADPDYRRDPVLTKYTSVGEALKALVESQRLLGSSIQIPRDGASDVQWRNIYEKLGCPKSASDYVVTDPPMGTDEEGHAKTLAPNFLVSLLDVAHQAGLNQKQAQAFVDFAARTVVQSEHIQAGEMAMQRAQSERELFEAFAGDAATMIQKATMAISRMGEGRYGGGAYAQRAAEKIRASALGNDVDVIAALANLWDNMSEGQFIESSTGSGLTSVDQVKADIAALNAVAFDEKKPYDERNAAQAKALQLWRDLNALEEAAQRRSTGFRR